MEKAFAFAAKLLLFTSVSFPVLGFAQENHSRTSITSEITYAAGSLEAEQIAQWLSTAPGAGKSFDSNVTFSGDVTVRLASVNSGGIRALQEAPPVPLPASGSNGQTFGISSCAGGVSRTWSYTWQSGANGSGGGWVLTSYTYNRTRSCGTGGA
ncbi:hypothetical protein GUF72_05225 [Xanthomonas citri pv. citri]|uniref:SH3 domain-containing protein n=3 Tax=Xanthomonas citri TaxID=346 RepID=A0AAI8ES71_XANAC|nr:MULTISPECIES: hypothetical protein [Xanthomonas]AAM37346.1 hypothetical protein XAC2495 [Xanthomonas citri pv. citri str. 306]APR10711.1 hypothetical protein BI314_11520 [Xanthomonas citri pv. citri]APR14042.1 hypothetical protein BI315_03395 [Xanthomonas citri pv. citri]APR20594.1 hypothetical protein BI316_14770 [Xanthomonas citri pv. citri]APR23383.1 hypothetical protein BJD09_03200 [Xanthomonas citri pv. citri]